MKATKACLKRKWAGGVEEKGQNARGLCCYEGLHKKEGDKFLRGRGKDSWVVPGKERGKGEWAEGGEISQKME